MVTSARGHGHDDGGKFVNGNRAGSLAPRGEDGLVLSQHGRRTRDQSGRFQPVRPPTPTESEPKAEVLEAGRTLAACPREARRALIEQSAQDGSLARVWLSMLRLAEKGSIPAGRMILEFALGRPSQAVEADIHVKVERALSADDIAEIERVLLACYPEGQVVAELPPPEPAPCGPCEAGPGSEGEGGEAPDAESPQH